MIFDTRICWSEVGRGGALEGLGRESLDSVIFFWILDLKLSFGGDELILRRADWDLEIEEGAF